MTTRHDLVTIARSPDNCPLGARWPANWRYYTLDTLRNPTVYADLHTGGDVFGGADSILDADWAVGPGDASRCRSISPLTSAKHRHCAFQVDGRLVHVDLLRATGTGPGFGLRALVAHVDGRFVGRAWVFGSLGGGGNNFPLLSPISDSVVLRGDYEDYTADFPALVLARRSSGEVMHSRGSC